MKKCLSFIILTSLPFLFAAFAHADGYSPASNLWIKAVIHTEDSGPVEAIWEQRGDDRTSGNDRVIWGYFYADPEKVGWGSRQNPELFVKIWFDRSGRLDVNFFHVSVPDIEVWSDYPDDGEPDRHSTATMSRRYVRHYYLNGRSYTEEKNENGEPPPGVRPSGSPSGYVADMVRIGAVIRTENSGLIDGIWQKGGEDSTADGHRVVWGHFFADPVKVNWGSRDNPDLFVKVWFDAGGRIDVNFFHVSVPDIEVYSNFPSQGGYDESGKTTLDNRYVRHEYRRNMNGTDPVADFSVSLASDTPPPRVTLDASGSYDPDGRIVRYEWKCSPDLGRTWEGQTQTIELPDSGTYTFTLTVTDEDGLQDQAVRSADISWPGTGEFAASEMVFADDYEKTGETCSRPSVRTRFDDHDKKVVSWVRYVNFQKDKPYEFRWYSPGGMLAQTDTGSRTGNVSLGCSWAEILTAKLGEYEPGEWRVAFFYDGREYWQDAFEFSSDTWGTDFKLKELVLTSQTPGENCDTPLYESDFGDEDQKIVAWAYYTYPEVGKAYEFRWLNPKDLLVLTSGGTHETDTLGGCAWAQMDRDDLVPYGSGQWTVEFYYDGEKYDEKNFSFTTDQPHAGFEVTDGTSTAASPGTQCEKPAPRTAFDQDDDGIVAWVSYRNPDIWDKYYEFRWYPPEERADGEPAQTNSGTYAGDSPEGCAWAEISPETLGNYESGQWRVEFHYSGQQYWVGYFDFSRPKPSFEVTELLLSDASPPDECGEPASGTAFDDNAEHVLAWVSYRNAEKDKPYEFRWYAPNGASAQVNTGTYAKDSGAGCSWYSIPADRLREYASGQWRVEFHYDGGKYEEKNFIFTSQMSKDFEVTEYLFTDQSPPAECGKPGSKSVFDSQNDLVYSWLRYRNFEAGKLYEFRWYAPDATLAKVNRVSDTQDAGTMGCLWNWISTDMLGEYGTGQWRTEFWYDGEKHGEGNFDFTSDDTELEVIEFLFTKETPGLSGCEAPSSQTSFGMDDAEVFVWIRYQRLEPGKTYAFRWYSPEGTLAQGPVDSSHTTDSRNGCLWESIPKETLGAYASGQWRVEFLYDGQKQGERSFAFASGYSDTEFAILHFLFTERYASGKCDLPQAPKEVFDENDDDVVAWIYYRKLEADKEYRFEWYSPDNVRIRTSEGVSTRDIARGCVWVSYSVSDLRRYGTGEWRVVFHYDDLYVGEESFRLE